MRADDGSGRPKIEAAKQALTTFVDGVPEGSTVGLRVYGHRVPNTDKANGCRDTDLVTPVRPVDKAQMKAAIGRFQPTGFTPIGYSLQEAAKDLPPRESARSSWCPTARTPAPRPTRARWPGT